MVTPGEATMRSKKSRLTKPPPGREALVHRPHLIEQRARDEHAVALPIAVDPVPVADEVTDLEQTVSVGWPPDFGQEPVLVFAVVAARDHPGLLARPQIPLFHGHDRGGVGREPEHPQPKDARGEQVGAVDHQGHAPSR